MEWNKTESDRDTDRVESANEKEQEKVEEKLAEEMEWPCGGICGENVTEDGIECVVCEKWYHVDCTDVVSPNDYISKPYTCKECSEKDRKKAKKPKDSTRGKGKVGRPKTRERCHSIPNYLTKEDWIKNKEWIAKNIEIKLKNKRNINKVGSPDKTETILEDKKRKKEEGTEKKEDEKKVDEEVMHSSPLKEKLYGINNYVASFIYGS